MSISLVARLLASASVRFAFVAPRSISSGLLVFCAMCAFVPSILAGPIGYSVRSNFDDHLYAIDLATGVAADLGLLNFEDAEGLAFAGDQLYAIGGSTDEFWNITTPPGSLIGPTGARIGIDAGLDYDQTQSKMYNINGDSGSSALYEIDIATGAATLVGADTFYTDGLAIDSNGNAFAADWNSSDSLYSVNLATGDMTLVGSLVVFGDNLQDGLAFDAANVLYALTSAGQIFTINTSTGVATLQAQVTFGGNDISGFEGLAIRVPEPSAMVLAAFGLVGLAIIGWRRKR